VVGTPTAPLSPLSRWDAQDGRTISFCGVRCWVPRSRHHQDINHRVEKGWGVPLVMGMVPSDLAEARASFSSLQATRALGELFFPTLI
jgi:hypothetical protein